MPPVIVSNDENTPTKPKTTPNIRRTPATRTPRNGGTPTRKTGGSKPEGGKTEGDKTPIPNAAPAKLRTPNSAPANARRASKKAEPTLLADFLLGRPSPQRVRASARRRSLDNVKKEMKLEAAVIGKVPNVGGVKDRVKQWQKASAAEVAAELAAIRLEEKKRNKGKPKEGDKPKSVGGGSDPRPGQPQSKEAEDSIPTEGDEIPTGGTAKDLAKTRSKSAVAPKKRVISDDHWMMNSEKKKAQQRKGQPIPKHFTARTINPPLDQKIKDWAKRNASEGFEEISPTAKDLKPESPAATPRKGRPIPANFVNITNNPPLAKKIDDWIQRSAGKEPKDFRKSKKPPAYETGEETPTRRKLSRQGSPEDVTANEEDTRRRKKTPREEQADDTPKSTNPSRQKASGDGIRIKPLANPNDDGIRIKPLDDRSVASKSSPQEQRSTDPKTPRKVAKLPTPSSPPSSNGSDSIGSSSRSSGEDHDTVSWTPSRKQSKRPPRKSDTVPESLDEIPLGNSAFSVFELPLGAEAGTIRRRAPQPKRAPSFSVPKVFKKVYHEARNIVHETADPQRAVNANPPNIESWLNGTSDPFVDGPPAPELASEAPVSLSRGRTDEEDHKSEQEVIDEAKPEVKRHDQSPRSVSDKGAPHSVERQPQYAREALPSMGRSSANSPVGLKRSPATRIASSPKGSRTTALKEAWLGAFRGESTTTQRSKNSPRADITELRRSRSPQELRDAESDVLRETPSKKSPPAEEDRTPSSGKEMPLLAYPKRLAPTTGMHRLSTIASVESFSTGSSASETGSELSQTTVTQDTLSTLPTESSLSRSTNKSGLKRRLTKHSDLLSVLSLPDPVEPGKAKSIRPARSIRTSRVRLETATIRGLMHELTDDETKYLRELNTLVDGVIPVLLSSVLSKSESAIAAGLFDANPQEPLDPAFTKPIVDMGVALERLRSLHKRIPLGDPEAISSWAHDAHKIYHDYLAAWRMGFQDLIVNLAPASPSTQDPPALDSMPRNTSGDVINAEGERVDVAFLLKRPLVRVKYLAKVNKGINKLKPTDLSKRVDAMWEDLESFARARSREESAKMVDRAANNTDATRARDLGTLALAEHVRIDRTLQVCAKDFFSLDMQHSSGQRIECQVELLLRDKPSGNNGDGDILVCAVDNVSRWLLLTPLPKLCTSARLGDAPGQLVVLVRGAGNSGEKWQETFLLETNDHETAAEWVDMLGKIPTPPALLISTPEPQVPTPGTGTIAGVEIPIGERRQRDAEVVMSGQSKKQKQRKSTHNPVEVDSSSAWAKPIDLNDAMLNAGKMLPSARAGYTTRDSRRQTAALRPRSSDSAHSSDSRGSSSSGPGPFMSGALPFIASPLEKQNITNALPGDAPPTPPTHRSPRTPTTLKDGLVLDSPTPKAKNRRTSSPLKHEYQPESPDDSDMSSDTDEELEEAELPGNQYVPPPPQRKRVTRSASSNLEPNSGQTSRDSSRPQSSNGPGKFTAMVSCWNGQKGAWEDVHNKICSIVVSPGLVETFVMSDPSESDISDMRPDKDAVEEHPLISQEITAFLNLRRSTALDVEIQSTLASRSQIKCSGPFRYRAPSPVDCMQLYNAIQISRSELPDFQEVEQERIASSYEINAYEAAISRRGFFGRRMSYRASARVAASVEPSEQSHSSAFSRLRRNGGGLFNIGRSSIDTGARKGNLWSVPSSAYGSRYSGASLPTLPGTPPSLSQANTSSSKDIGDLGNENLEVRLYTLETTSKWDDKGQASLTISQPLPGMRQASFLNNGAEKRITLSIKVGRRDGGTSIVVLDEVLGSNCFSKLGRTGIVVNVWVDIRGDGGEIGRIGRSGGVSGRTRKWLIQARSSREAAWIFGLTQRSALSY